MQQQKERMCDKKLRIGDLAKELKIKKYVIRFWEKEFELSSDRSQGGQRYYTKKDLDLFLKIKDLLYNEGFTIAGAKKQLQEKESSPVEKNIIAATKDHEKTSEKNDLFMKQLKIFKNDLLEFKDRLE